MTLEIRGIQLHLGTDNTEGCKASGREGWPCKAQPDTHIPGGRCQVAWGLGGADRKGGLVNCSWPWLPELLLSGELLRAGCPTVRNFEGQSFNPAIIKVK